jgi:ribonuclease J
VGLPGDEDYSLAEALEDLSQTAREALDELSRDDLTLDEAVKTLVVRRVKKGCQRIWDRRPIVEAVVLRV